MCTPILDCTVKKKRCRKQMKRLRKTSVKNTIFWINSRKDDCIISLEMSLTAPEIQAIISSSNGFFWRSVAVKLWILSTIHCIQLFLYSRITNGCRTEDNLPGIRAKWLFSFVNTAFTCSVMYAWKVSWTSGLGYDTCLFISPQATMSSVPNSKFVLALLPVL